MTGVSHHGADEVLRNVFWDLSQIGNEDGPKYSESVLRRLAAKILDGRAHELLAFRLCHLVRCATFAADDQGPQGWLEFFCASGAGRPGWAGGWLRARLPADRGSGDLKVAATPGHAVLRYDGDGPLVTISYGAMPLLAAFMEFLLNALHYQTVRDTLVPLSKSSLAWRELQDTANALSRAVYAWLQEHRRPVQESRDFEAIADFLAARGDRGDFLADDIDNGAVLAFWCAASVEPGSSFRTYRKTLRAFLRFAEALRDDTLREGFDSPASLDIKGESGMPGIVDPSSPGLNAMRAAGPATGVWEASGEEDTSPLEEISGAEIKFLLANEAKQLALVDAHALLLPKLAHSVLRDVCFGQAQARISQALRMSESVATTLQMSASGGRYDDEVAAFDKLLAHLEELIDASAFVLVGGDGSGDGDKVRTLNFEVLTRGRRALKGLRRQGFDELRSGEPEAIEALRRAVPAIVRLRERLAPLCARLRSEAPWAKRQEEDEPVFREQFVCIYEIAGLGKEESAS